MHGQNDAFFNLGKFKPTCMSTCISANKDHTSLVYQCNNVHTKKFQHATRNRWTIFRNFSDKEKKISCIRFSKKTTVLFKSNADTCLQNLPKFPAFLQILDHYKILTTFLWIFEAHTVLTGLNFWWDSPRGYSCDPELIEQKFILLCEFCYQNPSYCLVF